MARASTPGDPARADLSGSASSSRNVRLTDAPAHTVIIVLALSGVQRHPQPDLLWRRSSALVLTLPLDELGRQGLDEHALGDLG